MALDLKKIIKAIDKLEANKASAIKKRDEMLQQANAEIAEMQSQLDELNKTKRVVEKLMAQQEAELEKITRKVEGFKKKGKAEEEPEKHEEGVEEAPAEETDSEESKQDYGGGTVSEPEPDQGEETMADLKEPEQKQNFFFHR